MTNYLKLIKENANNVPSVISYFEEEYEKARDEIKIKGNLQRCISELPALYEIRFSQLQELEAIMEFFDIKLKGIRSSLYQKLLNNSQRALTSNDIKQYIDGDKNIMDLQLIINDIALVRNKFISLTKGFETKNWQLSNLTKLQCAGLDAIEI
jgi:hypothetical protein